ncbi:hypothetical protein ACFQZX_17815 [Mucilaginibacter litoreus]|uniref:Uncharacterized protein n=1 Tax=Mucilaginibacter litoreus TaxID=1048221 RepID=A0ABW3AYR7_9SPHI
MDMATNVMEKVYETLMCSPGMNEAVKVDLKINRKTILLLNNVIDNSLNPDAENQTGSLLKMLPQEAAAELKELAEECLKKAGLTELSEKIKSLSVK